MIDPGTNAYFSETRCSNVVTYLKKKYNIDASLFEVMGTPPDHPKESGTADELRRVEFSLTNRPSQAPETNLAATSAGPSNVLKPVVAAELFSQSKEIFFGSGKVTPSAEDRESLFQLGSALALEKNEDMIDLELGFLVLFAKPKSNAGNGIVDGWMIADMGKSRVTHQSCD